MHGSLFAFVHSRQRQHDQAIRNAALALLDSAAPPDVRAFIGNDSYAVAAKAIAAVFGAQYSLAANIVFDSGPLLTFRLAASFGAINSNRRRRWPPSKPFGLDNLRQIAASKERPIIAQRARLALAAFGEIDWQNADRQTRAAFIFALIVRVRHGK
jgi:hypothetical protein